MNTWYNLKTTGSYFDDMKAVALATVISKSNKKYKIVHTSVVSKYLRRLENVQIGYPTFSSNIVVLNLPDNLPFNNLCKKIATYLGTSIQEVCEPYIGFARDNNEIDRQLSKLSNVIITCYYQNEHDKSFISELEKVVDNLSMQQCNFVCCGSHREMLLKGAYDFRDVIQIDELIKNREKLRAVVTSSPFVKEMALLLSIPVVFLYSNALAIYINGANRIEGVWDNYAERLSAYLSQICEGVSVFELKSTLKTNENIRKKFEVPYNFDEDLIDYYSARSSFVNYLYLPPYAEDTFNTRTCMETNIKGYSYMPQAREEYEYHLRLISERNLRFVVLWQDRVNNISNEMLDYYSDLGTSGFIIANDANAERIKKYNPNLLVVSSIVQRLCKDISRKDFTYYDYIVLYYPFTRSLNAIKMLSKIKDKIVLMPNTYCHTDCLGDHHWFVKDIDSFDFEKSCPAIKDVRKSSFIRPEHLYLFDNYVGGYKLQGREYKTDIIVTICEAYFSRRTIDGLIPSAIENSMNNFLKDKNVEEYYNIKSPEIIDTI